jgi:uncharacterized protein
MNIIVFGATGQVGKQIVQQALFMDHHVKAFGRNVFTALSMEEKNLELIKGALFDASDVYHALKGCDAVLSALGGSADGIDKTRTLGIKNIVAQMNKAGVNRIIGIGGLGVLNADEESLLLDKEDYPKEYLPVGREHQQAWEYLRDSNLNWTFVCPPNIINAGPTGAYHTNANYPPQPNNYKINAGDLAMFMLNELQKNEYLKKRVGISN